MGIFLALFFAVQPGFAWDQHQEMVNRILLGPAAEPRSYLQKKISIPCLEEEQKELDALAARIQVRAAALKPVSKKKCAAKGSQNATQNFTVEQLLGMGFVDEPDQGMDQDLPDSADPEHYREWMGGSSGPTSQGFRHMVFPGIEWSSPLRTFQLPKSKVGDAFRRIEVLGQASKQYFSEGNVFFGIRTLLWKEHFIQDLLQPFHSTQIPSLKFIPWKKIFKGPVKQTSHAISNYHYAFEGTVLEMVKAPWERGIQECFEIREVHPYEGEAALLRLPRAKAYEVGELVYAVFGDYLKSDTVDLAEGIGAVDYYGLVNAKNEELTKEEISALSSAERDLVQRANQSSKALDRIKQVSCELMKEASRIFWGDLDQAFSYSTSINTGK
jgi:hypothetical protein